MVVLVVYTQHENKGSLYGLLLSDSEEFFVGIIRPIMSDWIKISSHLLQGRNSCIYMKLWTFGNKSKLLGKLECSVTYSSFPSSVIIVYIYLMLAECP